MGQVFLGTETTRLSLEHRDRMSDLTGEFLAHKPLVAAIDDELMEYLSAAKIILHSAASDTGCLDRRMCLPGRPTFVSPAAEIKDSLIVHYEVFPGKAYSLDALCWRMEVDNPSQTRHATHRWIWVCGPSVTVA